jgi:ParB/RepB/Spo0J family partition protein
MSIATKPRAIEPEPSPAWQGTEPPQAGQLEHAKAIQVNILSVVPSPTNPRKTYDKAALDELTKSIEKWGVFQPLLIRPWPQTVKLPKDVLGAPIEAISGGEDWAWYELVSGERRLRAASVAGLTSVPALVRELSDDEVLEVQLIENLQRADLHPLEEAEGYRRMIAAGFDLARVADRIGRSVKHIYDRQKLLALTKASQQLFRGDQITLGHAIILARLSAADQARAIGNAKAPGPLFALERLLWDPRGDAKDRAEPFAGLKAITPRELQAWVDKHVRFDPQMFEPMLFPETVQVLAPAKEKAEKIIPITHDHYIDPAAKNEGERTYGPMSWRRADGKAGSKPCPHAVTGVIVVGFGRGEAFRVCLAKKSCSVHWADEQKAAKKRTAEVASSGKTGAARQKLQEQKAAAARKQQEDVRARWKKAAPAILEAVAAAVRVAPAKATGQLAEIVVQECLDWRQAPKAGSLVPRGKSAEDLVRHAAFLVLSREVLDEYLAPSEFPKRAKALGIDITAILERVSPVAAAAKATAKSKPGVEARCRECNCTEDDACDDNGKPCSWVEAPDPKTGRGLCSACQAPAPRKAASAKKGRP